MNAHEAVILSDDYRKKIVDKLVAKIVKKIRRACRRGEVKIQVCATYWYTVWPAVLKQDMEAALHKLDYSVEFVGCETWVRTQDMVIKWD